MSVLSRLFAERSRAAQELLAFATGPGETRKRAGSELKHFAMLVRTQSIFAASLGRGRSVAASWLRGWAGDLDADPLERSPRRRDRLHCAPARNGSTSRADTAGAPPDDDARGRLAFNSAQSTGLERFGTLTFEIPTGASTRKSNPGAARKVLLYWIISGAAAYGLAGLAKKVQNSAKKDARLTQRASGCGLAPRAAPSY